jgi:hypothetical protein
MTVEGNRIRCDAYGCRTESTFDAPIDLEPDRVRIRFAMLGWDPGGDVGRLDLCPVHA